MDIVKLVVIVVFLSSLSFYLPILAEAHFLVTDKNIGAVLHVEPNDEPVAGKPASFFFDFKDKQNKFTPQNCDCTFEIDENGKDIFSQALFHNETNPSLATASVTYAFHQRGVYQVKVIGKPLTPNEFQPFTLTWDFRIDQAVNKQDASQKQTFFTNFGIVAIICLVLFGNMFALSTVYNKQKQSQKKN
jgi:hypothetical protein